MRPRVPRTVDRGLRSTSKGQGLKPWGRGSCPAAQARRGRVGRRGRRAARRHPLARSASFGLVVGHTCVVAGAGAATAARAAVVLPRGGGASHAVAWPLPHSRSACQPRPDQSADRRWIAKTPPLAGGAGERGCARGPAGGFGGSTCYVVFAESDCYTPDRAPAPTAASRSTRTPCRRGRVHQAARPRSTSPRAIERARGGGGSTSRAARRAFAAPRRCASRRGGCDLSCGCLNPGRPRRCGDGRCAGGGRSRP